MLFRSRLSESFNKLPERHQKVPESRHMAGVPARHDINANVVKLNPRAPAARRNVQDANITRAAEALRTAGDDFNRRLGRNPLLVEPNHEFPEAVEGFLWMCIDQFKQLFAELHQYIASPARFICRLYLRTNEPRRWAEEEVNPRLSLFCLSFSKSIRILFCLFTLAVDLETDAVMHLPTAHFPSACSLTW